MENKNINDILNFQVDMVKKQNPCNTFFYAGLVGSQNYKMDSLTSDVDCKAIFLPSKWELILNKQSINREYKNETGIVLAKELRDMVNIYKKCNINFLESLFTDYFCYNPIFENEIFQLREYGDMLVKSNPLRIAEIIFNIFINKEKSLYKETPSTKDDIDKFGYSLKNLHHMVRIYFFMYDLFFNNDLDFKASLVPSFDLAKDVIYPYKYNPMKLAMVENIREAFKNNMSELFDSIKAKYDTSFWSKQSQIAMKKTNTYLDYFCYKILNDYFKEVQ